MEKIEIDFKKRIVEGILITLILIATIARIGIDPRFMGSVIFASVLGYLSLSQYFKYPAASENIFALLGGYIAFGVSLILSITIYSANTPSIVPIFFLNFFILWALLMPSDILDSLIAAFNS